MGKQSGFYARRYSPLETWLWKCHGNGQSIKNASSTWSGLLLLSILGLFHLFCAGWWLENLRDIVKQECTISWHVRFCYHHLNQFIAEHFPTPFPYVKGFSQQPHSSVVWNPLLERSSTAWCAGCCLAAVSTGCAEGGACWIGGWERLWPFINVFVNIAKAGEKVSVPILSNLWGLVCWGFFCFFQVLLRWILLAFVPLLKLVQPEPLSFILASNWNWAYIHLRLIAVWLF